MYLDCKWTVSHRFLGPMNILTIFSRTLRLILEGKEEGEVL